MNLPEVHSREAVVDTAELELCEYLYQQQEPLQFADCFGAYGCLLMASAMTAGGLTCRELPPRIEAFVVFLLDLHKRHGLTTGEIVSLIANRLASDAKYVIRWERHGCTDKPGGLA